MSYIHEALKKAQVERDLGKGSYDGITALRRKKAFFTRGKGVFLGMALLVVLLAFVGYSWQRTEDGGQKTEDRGQRTEGRGQLSVVRPPSSVVRRQPPAKQKTEKGGESIAVSYQKARAFHRKGHLPEAGLWYDKAISMDPGHVQALNNRGVLHLHEKNYPAARKCFEKAIRLKPDYVDPYYNLACVSAATNQAKQGIRYLGKAITMDPEVKGWARKDPDLDPLRGTPGFVEIMKKDSDE